jgi:hypothetical protein
MHMAWRPTAKQWMAFWPAAIFGVLSLMAGNWITGILLFLAAGVLIWQLQPRGKPENIVVKSVKCGDCGTIGEPHWARCPKCGAANWKAEG